MRRHWADDERGLHTTNRHGPPQGRRLMRLVGGSLRWTAYDVASGMTPVVVALGVFLALLLLLLTGGGVLVSRDIGRFAGDPRTYVSCTYASIKGTTELRRWRDSDGPSPGCPWLRFPS